MLGHTASAFLANGPTPMDNGGVETGSWFLVIPVSVHFLEEEQFCLGLTDSLSKQ